MRLFDSLSQSKKNLPATKRTLGIYVCGPTVYDTSHLGHARTYLAFDILVRYLRFKNFKVNYVQNITDVDDKIIDRARQQKISPRLLATRFTKSYYAFVAKLDIKSVDKYIRVSSRLPAIKNAIAELIDKDMAYETKRGVYFRVRRFKSYGCLSGQNITALRAGYRIEPDPDKEDVLDFALWKKQSVPQGAVWTSPWGKGRPGWHIECSTLIKEEFKNGVDIHGGGLDLKFPHHEAEIAQTESICHSCHLAKIWLHTGLLLVKGTKMSKSLGNFIVVDDLLSKYDVSVLRWLVLSSHYRSSLDYSDESMTQSVNALLSIKKFLAALALPKSGHLVSSRIKRLIKNLNRDFNKAMSDDLNTPEALASFFIFINHVQEIKTISQAEADLLRQSLLALLSVLGLNLSARAIPKAITLRLEQREVYRTTRNFSAADDIRDQLAAEGFLVDDTPLGSVVVFNNLISYD